MGTTNQALHHIEKSLNRGAPTTVDMMCSAMGVSIDGKEAESLSPLAFEKARVDGALAHIENLVDLLGARISPVLRPPQNVESLDRAVTGTRDPEPAHAALVHDLRYTLERMRRVAESLEALHSRLVV